MKLADACVATTTALIRTRQVNLSTRNLRSADTALARCIVKQNKLIAAYIRSYAKE